MSSSALLSDFESFQTTSCISLETLAMTIVLAAMLYLWLAGPGGLAWALSRPRQNQAQRIPGPKGNPFTGSLSEMTHPTPHRALASLAARLGAEPLMAFSVGLTRFVVASRADTAKEILGSPYFADRPVKESAYELLFHRAIGFAPYGEYWRGLRRIASTHLFSPKKISDFSDFRRSTGVSMVDRIKLASGGKSGGSVSVREVLHFGSLSNVMMTVFGRSYDFSSGGGGSELEAMVKEGYEILGMFNWSDHFPLLGLLDLQGVRKRSRALVNKVNAFVGKIIEEHREKNDGERVGDFVDVLLDLEQTNADENTRLSHSDMIAVLWEMIFRGTDTVAILLEWILARMVLHPEIQSKAQSEIDAVVGKARPVSDSDIPNLPYLQAVVKEALRAHPPGPLLSWARLSTRHVSIGDALIPAGTTAMVNMWAITHDPAVWPEPEAFRPERFLEKGSAFEDLSVMGSDLRLAPFGAGRRVCPGKSLGLASAHLWLAILLQSFDFVPTSNGVDLTEVLNLSLEMKNPLVCKAVPRALSF